MSDPFELNKAIVPIRRGGKEVVHVVTTLGKPKKDPLRRTKAVGIGVAVAAPVGEAERRYYNRRGAGVKAGTQYVHPIKTKRAYNASVGKSAPGDPFELNKTVSEAERKKLAHRKHPKAQRNGSFPIPDKAHAKAALMDIKSAPPAERPSIRAQAHQELKKSLPGDPFGLRELA